MTLEERVELHDQWIQSIESNLSRVVDTLAAVSEQQVQLAEQQNRLATALIALPEQHRKLEETVERYIRFRGDGREN